MALKISIIIAALGFLPLLIVLLKRKRRWNLVTKGDLVTGTVLEVYHRRGYKGGAYYQAQIEYPVFNQAPMQRTYMFTGKKSLDYFYKGRRLDICYSKKKPTRFVPKDMWKNNGFLIFAIIIAVGYLVLAYFLYGLIKGAHVS
ncbi:MAG TPA: DUF3592 domain-containing protein [Chryseolinea sp.]|nr:DUF3592 domain-containing protein [Chryseolinea sp.]